MDCKFDIKDLSEIINKDEQSSFDETLNNLNLLLEDNINIKKNNNKINTKTFEDVLSETKNKFQKLTKTFEKIKIPNNFMDKIIKNNIHLQYIFKDKNLNIDDIYNIPKYIESKNNFKNKEENKDSNNFIDEYSKEETKDTKTNNKFFYMNIIKNKNESKNIFSKINKIKDFIIYDNKTYNSENLENMTNIVGIKSNYNKNQLNFSSNIKNKENNNISLIGKKRNNEDKNLNNINKEDIINEIRHLYDKYNKNNKRNFINNSYYKLYEDIDGFFKKNITIIENNYPICVIYFKHKIIEKIYLIRDEIFIEDENEILEVLNKIKSNISKLFKEKV